MSKKEAGAGRNLWKLRNLARGSGKDFFTFVIYSGWKHFILADKLDPESWFSGWEIGSSKGAETHVGNVNSTPAPVVWAIFL